MEKARHRLMKFAKVSTSIAGKVASQQVKGIFQSEEQKQENKEELLKDIGEQVTEALSQMKGAAMKVGQILSVLQDFLPPEITDKLTKLQNAAEPLEYSIIAKQIEKNFGKPVDELFKSFDEKAFAAASIGQVHRAVTYDSVDVVVKVQYPGVSTSIDSDLKNFRRILRLGGLLNQDKAVLDAMFNEIKGRLCEELDYTIEANNVKRFSEAHANDDKVIIPSVIDELSSREVLTLQYVPGDSLQAIESGAAGYSQEDINHVSNTLVDAVMAQVFDHHCFHADPHPGNFAFTKDGGVIIYDFGSVKHIDKATTDLFVQLLQAVEAKDYKAVDDALIAMGNRKKDKPISLDFYDDWLQHYTYLLDDKLDLGDTNFHRRLAKQMKDANKMELFKNFQPSTKNILMNHVLSGQYWILRRLGAQIDLGARVQRIIVRQSV